MNHFADPSLKLVPAGMLKLRTAEEIESSSLAIGFETLDREMFLPEQCYDALAGAGAKWARCQTGWNRCELTVGAYDFSWLDNIVDNLLSRGVQPWFNLGFGNKLYMPRIPNESGVGCVPTGYGSECLAAWQKFVTAVAEHFSERVGYWEIWNEPNLDLFWQPSQANGTNFAELVAVTAPFIKAVNPNAKIGGCCSGIDVAFIRQALEAGIGNNLDWFSIHPYATLPERNYFSAIAATRQLFRIYASHIELHQGECGYPSQTYGHQDSWLTPYFASEETQAKFVLRRIVLDSMANLKRISYFHIVDLIGKVYRLADGKARPPIRLGLLHGEDYTKKAAWYAFASMAAIFDGQCQADDLYTDLTTGWELRQTGALPFLAPVIGTFVRHGFPLYAYYYPEDLQRDWLGMNKTVLTVLAQQPGLLKIETPVLIDGLSGTVYRISDYENDATGYLRMNGLPLTDYPLIVTDAATIEIQ